MSFTDKHAYPFTVIISHYQGETSHLPAAKIKLLEREDEIITSVIE